MAEIMFSVIIPLFQKESFIARAIDSVLAQSYSDFELIVVDDGSKDNGPLIVESYADKRIRLIRQSNQGVSVARNRGIAEAQSDYLAFLDADDKWEQDFLLEMKRLIETYPGCGWYSCGWNAQDDNGSVVQNNATLKEGVITNFFEIAMKDNIVNSSSVVVPKQVFSQIGGFQVGLSKGEDLIMWTNIASKFPICYTNKILSWYFYDEKNGMTRIRNSEPDFFECLLEPDNFFKNEFLAGLAIHKGILESIYGDKKIALEIAEKYNFTILQKAKLKKLNYYNKFPSSFLKLFFRTLRFLVQMKKTIVNEKNKGSMQLPGSSQCDLLVKKRQ